MKNEEESPEDDIDSSFDEKEIDEEKDDEVSQLNVTNPEQLRTLESEHKPES
jgi:hypothetical protein